MVKCPQGIYNRRRPCDDGGGAKGGDGRDEREAAEAYTSMILHRQFDIDGDTGI